MKAEIWMICSEICLEIFSAAECMEAKGEEDFRGFHGFRGYERQRDAKGEDLHAEIAVTFEEAVFGCDKTFTFKDPNSQGVSKSLQVHIPAGIDTGKSIRLRGKGMPGVNGGENGDLFLKVNVGVKAGYERKGADVYTTVFVPYTTAVFGGRNESADAVRGCFM